MPSDLQVTNLKANDGTAGLVIADSTGNVTISGNAIIGTAGKGIDFSNASGSGSGSSSALLDDYEEGTWTTTTSGETNCSSVSLSEATYTKIGRSVTLIGRFSLTFSSGSTTTQFAFTIPFSMMSSTHPPAGAVDGYDGNTNILGDVSDYTSSNATNLRMIFPASSVSSGATSGGWGIFSITYFTS